MLKSLHIRNFTVFRDAKFEFSPGLNVIVGDNGTGKTHLLKLGYLFSRAWPDLKAKRLSVTTQRAESYLAERLAGLFLVPDLGALIRQGHKNGARVTAEIDGHIPTTRVRSVDEPVQLSPGLSESMPWDVQIKNTVEASGTLQAKVLPAIVPDTAAVNAFLPRQIFVPSKEIVSLFKGLVGLFETYRGFPLDDTYRDLALALSTLEPKTAPSLFDAVAQPLQKLLGGDLRLENDDLLFLRDDGSKLFSQLLAEGHRKLSMLVYLLRNGLVEPGSTLFWDEPEANLNPASLKLLIHALHRLSGLGVQVIVATHSLYLLREIEILQMHPASRVEQEPGYFGLSVKQGSVVVTQGNQIADIDPLVTLDENLMQSDRYLEAEHATAGA